MGHFTSSYMGRGESETPAHSSSLPVGASPGLHTSSLLSHTHISQPHTVQSHCPAASSLETTCSLQSHPRNRHPAKEMWLPLGSLQSPK